ncbi:hypothetical protein DL96DRAFT_1156558 [Flagelloscypha sp. PMI_526]|nr:hypothetical protein DL96DRAFT_1156558 [Flagelloscypha sp. PMI_526]
MNYESELLPFGDDFIFFNLETQPHEQFGPYSDQPLHFDGGSLGLLDPFHDPLHNSKDELSLSIGMPGSNFHLPQPGPVQLQLNPSQATLPPLPAEIFTLYDNQTTPSPPSSASQTPPSELERHISPPRVPDNRPSHFPRLSRTAATSSSSRPAPTRSRVKKPKAVRSKANGLIRCLCPTCPQTFSRTSDMDRHIKTGIHPDIGPGISLHICPSCQKGFGRKDSRDRHIAKQACNKRAEPCTSRVRHLPRPKAGDPFSS